MLSAAATLASDLQRQILDRTNRRVRNLAIEFRPGRVVLRGQARSYHVKQLALHGLLDALPGRWRIENAITVTSAG
jgi:hypothetical protein